MLRLQGTQVHYTTLEPGDTGPDKSAIGIDLRSTQVRRTVNKHPDKITSEPSSSCPPSTKYIKISIPLNSANEAPEQTSMQDFICEQDSVECISVKSCSRHQCDHHPPVLVSFALPAGFNACAKTPNLHSSSESPIWRWGEVRSPPEWDATTHLLLRRGCFSTRRRGRDMGMSVNGVGAWATSAQLVAHVLRESTHLSQ